MGFDIMPTHLYFSIGYPIAFLQTLFCSLSHATVMFSAFLLGSTELRKMTFPENSQGLIRDQLMWRTLCPDTFQLLPGTVQKSVPRIKT